MADKRYGYMTIWRGIWDNYIYASDQRFDDRSAWLWLLFDANYKENEIITKRGTHLIIKRGQVFTSIRSLAQKFHWNERTVMRFLYNIKSTGMIDYKTTRDGTLITLLNYNKYNGSSDHDKEEHTTEYNAECNTGDNAECNAEYIRLNKGNTGNTGISKGKEASAGRRGKEVFEE